jgi:hypothetical protein
VENAEVEVALEELENRLERLRALYEQYFMGIERIEPAIPRKDVDRRIYVLRREKIRNTAKRFKLQTIISRYNTFQQYWQRICREIENGTYKRHLIRAERIAPGQMLTIAARKRLGRAALEMATADSVPPPARESARPPSVQPPAAVARSSLPAAAPLASSLVPRPGVGAPPPKPVPPPKPGARPAKPSAPVEAVAPKFESLDFDLDFLGDWDPSASAGKSKRAPEVPARPFGRALNQPLGAAPPATLLNPGVRAAKPVIFPAPPPAPPRIAERPLIAPRPPPAPAPIATSSSPIAAPARPAPPRPALGSAATAATAPAPTRPAPLAPAAPIVPKPIAPAATAVAPAKPPAKPAVAASLATAAPRPTPAIAAAGTITDDRVRELHARLVEAKRQTQDAAAVSIEGLAKSMKATEAKLREQHKNRRIDFDVVIKDGKAVLKPIVR